MLDCNYILRTGGTWMYYLTIRKMVPLWICLYGQIHPLTALKELYWYHFFWLLVGNLHRLQIWRDISLLRYRATIIIKCHWQGAVYILHGRGCLVRCYHLLHRRRVGQVKRYVTDTLVGSARVLSFLHRGRGVKNWQFWHYVICVWHNQSFLYVFFIMWTMDKTCCSSPFVPV